MIKYIATLIFGFILGWMIMFQFTPKYEAEQPSAIDIEKLHESVNEKRLQMGLPPLTLDQELIFSSQEKALTMKRLNCFAHDCPFGNEWRKTVYRYCPLCLIAGENLARDFKDEEKLLDAWLQSEGHRENVLREEFDIVGYSYIETDEGNYVVQHLGSKINKLVTKQ